MDANASTEAKLPPSRKPSWANKVLAAVAWVIALGLVACAVYLGWRAYTKQPIVLSDIVFSSIALAAIQEPQPEPQISSSDVYMASLPTEVPAYGGVVEAPFIPRRSPLHTTFPNRPRQEVHTYIVDGGDSVFEIAAKFKLMPETVLWANYAQLDDNPDLISVGMELYIPPVDGVLYQWQEGDTVEAVASRFEAKPEDILNWPSNGFDLIEPEAEQGTLILVPGGHREFRQWVIPTIPRGSAGVSKELYGAGACEGGYDGAFGTGTFVWPAANHRISGNDYWSGHLGIDIAAGDGAPIYAADSGVIVFAGWARGGYGNMVMIDHGNGYQTLYAHLASVSVGCGRSVGQGTTIGYAGSTGNSTGTHLHFEVRYQGGFVSPWYVLPAP